MPIVWFCFFNIAGLLIKGVSPKSYFPLYKEPGIAYPLVLFLYAFGVNYGLYFLFITYRKLTGYQRNRLKLFLGATIIGFAGGLPYIYAAL